MDARKIKQEVLELLRSKKRLALTPSEIASRLTLRGKARKKIQKWLHQLVSEGELVIIRGNRYTLGDEADLVSGTLDLTRAGDGYVTRAGRPQDIFIPRTQTGTALPGDKVMVRIDVATQRRQGRGSRTESKADGRPVGKVIRIVERAAHDVVGTLKTTGRFFYVVPMAPGYKHDFYVDSPGTAGVGDRVVARFVNWANKHVNPEAEIVEVIGPADNPSTDTLAVMRQYGFREEFPVEVVHEAEQAAGKLRHVEAREDLRESTVLTIDPVRARDFDDALSLDKDGEGRLVLGVHIADVSHFVTRGSAMDEEARQRGNSVYLPDKVVPMLPEQLSNGVCSLRPDEDRLAFSAFLTFDERATRLKHRFARTIIRSSARLNYEQAQDILDGEEDSTVPPECRELLRRLHALAHRLRRRRFGRYALDLNVPECEVEIDAGGMISDIHVVENTPSHQLIEECMIAANEAVAVEVTDAGLPLISRFHDAPTPVKIADLTAELKGLGYSPGNLAQRRNLASFLRSIEHDALAYYVRIEVLKSMSRAVYSSRDTGHYGLAKKFYTHFTSPIRRYPDLTVHRQLSALLTGERGQAYPADDLLAVARHCSDTEQAADMAEKDIIEIKKYRLLERELAEQRPRTYDAVVVNVVNFGMFVELLELQIQGLVHISTISERFVRHNKQKNTLRAGRKTYKVGDRVRVFVTKVDFAKRQIDFGLDRSS